MLEDTKNLRAETMDITRAALKKGMQEGKSNASIYNLGGKRKKSAR
jgi:hypothetical protein